MNPPNERRARLGLAALVLAAGLGGAPAAGARDLSELAGELARLRAEVEDLSGKVQAEKDETRARLRSLGGQRADLEMELRRETLKLEQLRQGVEERKEEARKASAAEATLAPAIRAAIEVVEAAVAASLPYRLPERTGELKKLRDQLDEGLLAPGAALARLWETVEDELRVGRESALDRQVLEVGGKEVLAEVLHVGLAALYFRTDDGRLGRAVKGPGGWTWELYTDELDLQRVAALFDAFDKRIRVGFFEVPNAVLAPAGAAPGGAP